MAQQEDVVEQVWQNLADVIDPCSRMNGTHLNLVELGMIESVAETTPHEVTVKLFLDDPMCIYMVDIHRQVRAAASAVDGVDHVEIDVVADRLWTSEHMHESIPELVRGGGFGPFAYVFGELVTTSNNTYRPGEVMKHGALNVSS